MPTCECTPWAITTVYPQKQGIENQGTNDDPERAFECCRVTAVDRRPGPRYDLRYGSRQC